MPYNNTYKYKYNYPSVLPFLYSPQARAVTGLRTPIPYGDYIRTQAQYLPELMYQRRMQQIEEERRAEEQKRFDIAQRQAGTEFGLNVGTTGARALAYEPVYKGFTKPILYERGIKPMFSAIMPGARATTSLPLGIMPSEGVEAISRFAEPIIPSEMGTMQSALAKPIIPSEAFSMQGALPTTQTAARTGVLPTIGRYAGTAARIGGQALAPISAGMTAGSLVRQSNLGEYMHKQAGGGEREWDVGAGMALGAAWGTVLPGVGNLVGGLLGGLAGGIMGYKKRGSCIIVTTCTSPNSPEVQVCREYRDNFLTKEEIRGYYMLADQIVPMIEENDELKESIKTNFVDRFVDYAEVSLKKKDKFEYTNSATMSIRFLNICRNLGKTIPRYIRENGEVV